jgi:hypothetical protein
MSKTPRNSSSIVGHALSALLGLLMLAQAVAGAMAASVPALTFVASSVIGVLLLGLTWGSLRGARAPWAFLLVLNSIMGFATFIAAPKIARLADIDMMIAGIQPLLFVIAAVQLALCADAYGERRSGDVAPL